MEVEADQVHVEGDRGRDVRPVLQVAKEAHGNVQAAERGGDKIDGNRSQTREDNNASKNHIQSPKKTLSQLAHYRI